MPKVATAPFPAWDKDKAVAKVAADIFAQYATNKMFITGDHWQDGTGWIGPIPGLQEEGYAEVVGEIQRGFTSRNIMLEVVERHATGVMGRPPSWSLVPRRAISTEDPIQDAERADIAEVEASLRIWWNERNAKQVLQDAVARALWGMEAPVRLFIPKGNLDTVNVEGKATTGVMKPKDLESALRLIFPESLEREVSRVYTDPDTRADVGIFKYKTGDPEQDWVELTYLDTEEPTAQAAGPEDAPFTVIRQIGPDNEVSVKLPLGGRLTMYSINRTALLTTQVQQMQRAFNLALTMVPRAVVTSGFLERIILNGQMPGEWEHDESGARVRFKPGAPLKMGAGTTNFITGVDFQDEDGKVKLANPAAVFREPSQITPIKDAKDVHYQDILNECDQAHILINSSEYASGRSREQSRADYRKSLEVSQEPGDGAGRWLLETALRLGEVFMGTPGRWTDKYRINFYAVLDTGMISVEERKQNAEEAEKGFMSHNTAMLRNGTDDPAAEIGRIQGQPEAVLALKVRKANLMKIFTDAGMDVKSAALSAGFDQAEVDIMKEKPEPAPKVPAAG